MENFLELKGFWEELKSNGPLPICTCAHICHCNVVQKTQEYKLEDQAIWFLIGLNDTFSVVKTKVLLMDHFPPINRIYSLVVQE